MINKIKLVMIMAATTAISHISAANLVNNGNFEASPFDTDWTQSGVTSSAGLTGSGTAAGIAASGSLMQDFTTAPIVGPTEYQLDFMLSLGGTSGSQRIRLRGDNNTGDIITLKMDSAGLYKYGGSWYNAVPGTYSADTPYYIRVEVGNFDADAAPEYVVSVSTDGISYDSSVTMGSFHGDGTRPFETIRFEGGTDGMIVDEVTVIPEPATLGLLAVFGSCIFFIRRTRAY